MYSEGNSFDEILARLLANVDDSLDKREGSIIYDALAPAAAELAQCYITLDIFTEQTYLLTATGENLDKRVAECGLERIQATPSQVIINTYNSNNTLYDVPIGSRFSTPNEYGGVNFEIKVKQSTGTFMAECEEVGTIGNDYTGDVLPLQSINNLGNAIISSIYKPGEDTEDDETLRARAIRKLNQESFAGNKAAYREMCIAIDGVADCKVFPVWNGGGTVKLALIGPDHTLLSEDAVTAIQNMIDPSSAGQGVGMAPIGHSVTVVTPTAQNINISATLTLESGATIQQLQTAIEEQIGKYLYQVQEDFIDNNVLIVYLAKVSAAILNVKEVKNVSSLKINNSASDYTIDNSAGTTIKYPILNEVVLSAST